MNVTEAITLFFIAALAGLGLILLGTRLLSEGLQILMARWIRQIVNLIGENSLVSLLAGALTSLMIQSRTSASIMAVSFAGSGLINLNQLMLFLTGAGVGTLLTVWIFAFESGRLDLYFLALGVIPMLHARWDYLSGLGRVIFSLGLLLLGFDIIVFGASDPELISTLFIAWLPSSISSTSVYLLLLLCAVAANVVVRSTVALVALVMAFTATGVFSLGVGMVLIFGINLGATLPVVTAALRSNQIARQGSFVQLLNHLILVFVAMPFVSVLLEFFTSASHIFEVWLGVDGLSHTHVFFIPLVHLIYNLVAVVLAITLHFIHMNWLTRVSAPSLQKKERQQLKFLGRPSHLAPSLAIEQASQEVKKMAAMTQAMLHMTRAALRKEEKQTESRVQKYENITDRLLAELSLFITKVMQSSLTKKQSLEAASLLQMAVELEGVADCCEQILKSKSASKDSLELSPLESYFEMGIATFESIFPLLTEQISHSEEVVSMHEQELEALVKKAQIQFRQVVSAGVVEEGAEAFYLCLQAVNKIIEHSKAILAAKTGPHHIYVGRFNA